MKNHDQVFLKKFSIVMAILIVLTLILILFARHLHTTLPAEQSPSALRNLQARIAPVGEVYAGATGAAAAAAAKELALQAAASQVAYGGTLDGKVIYDQLCTGCHTSGAGNAPTLDHAHWDARIAQGKETLYKHSIEGFTGPDGGVMPPKGGNPALTDEQMHATVDWMLDNLK